jgi:hypothetical protein
MIRAMKQASLLIALLAFVHLSASINPIKLIQVNGTPFNAPIAPEHHEPSGTLLLSVNYPNGNPFNFERVLFNGSHVPFSTLSGLTEEIKMASVRSHHVKSLAQGFKVGDMFTGNGNDGEVLKIETNPDGKDGTITRTWVKLSAPGGGSVGLLRGGLNFDHTGDWNGDLIISTDKGYLFRVTASGQATYVANINYNLEGVITVPNNRTKYGDLAGAVLTGTTSSNNILCAFYKDGSTKSWSVRPFDKDHAWEDFDFVVPFNNFFGIDYGSNRMLAAKASDWKGLEDEIIVTEEYFVTSSCKSSLYLLGWNNNAPSLECIPVTSDSMNVVHWEHVTFSSSGINNIPPSFDVCYVGYDDGVEFQARPYPLAAGTLPSVLYGYNTAAAYSPNPHADLADTAVPKPQPNSVVMYFSMTDTNQLYFTILVDDPTDGTAGELTLSITSPTFPDAQTTVLLSDDPTNANIAAPTDFPDKFNWQDGNGLFQFKWGNGTADGVILGPMPLFEIPNLERGYCLKPKILSSTGIQYVKVADYFVTDSGNVFYYELEDVNGEPEICVYRCDKFCFLFDSCGLCNLNSKCNWCGNFTDGQCTDKSSATACPAEDVETTCPCSEYAFLGCDTCNNAPGCEWCCAGGNSTCASLSNAATCPGTFINTTCNDLNACKSDDFLTGCLNGGTCTCGVCNCPPGLAGDHCEFTLDCAGVPNGNNTLNECGLCNSTDLSCIGCDGKPFGINYYDECGVCGGDGSSCFSPCNYTLCTECIANEACYWCYLDQKCISPLYVSRNETCTEKDDQPSEGEKECRLPPEAVIGLTAGAIAGIVIGVAVAVGLATFGAAKGTVDYYRRRNANLAAAVVSPIYKDPVQGGNNVLYEPK